MSDWFYRQMLADRISKVVDLYAGERLAYESGGVTWWRARTIEELRVRLKRLTDRLIEEIESVRPCPPVNHCGIFPAVYFEHDGRSAETFVIHPPPATLIVSDFKDPKSTFELPGDLAWGHKRHSLMGVFRGRAVYI